MSALPGEPAVDGEQLIIEGQWQGLQPASAVPGVDDNAHIYTVKRVDMVSSTFSLPIPSSDRG